MIVKPCQHVGETRVCIDKPLCSTAQSHLTHLWQISQQEQNKIVHKAIHMNSSLILASSSVIRLSLLRSAGIHVTECPAKIDESAIRLSMQADGAKPYDVADTLAEIKARRIAEKYPENLVLGCDQILEINEKILSKPENIAQVREQLDCLVGQTHRLLSAMVIYEHNQPVWRHIGIAKMTMRSFSQAYIDGYLSRNWPDISTSLGGYKLESEGVRLFSRIEGDYFTILGLPLLPLLGYLGDRGFLQT